MDDMPTNSPWALPEAAELFLRTASAGANQAFWLDSRTALMPGGHNGPYLDLESPVRNSAHWLATMSIAHHLTGDTEYLRVGRGLLRYLLSEAVEIGGSQIHRQRFPKDWTNGVIGPAWVSEGLQLAGRYLKIDEATAAASGILRRLGFDEISGLWRVSDPASGSVGVDRTVNHQVFCTAMAADLTHDELLTNRVETFVEKALPDILRTGNEGVLVHHVSTGLRGRAIGALVARARRASARGLRRAALQHGAVTDLRERDLGYHVFSLFALCRLAQARPGSDLTLLPPVRSATVATGHIITDDAYAANPYAYAYNPAGFELPGIARTGDLGELMEPGVARRAYETQIERTLDVTSGLLTRSTTDPLVLSARGYELGLLHV